MHIRQLPVFLIGRLCRPQSALDKILIQKQGCVSPVVIIKLLIGYMAVIADSVMLLLIDHMASSPVDHRLQSHLAKLSDSSPDNPLKSQTVTDIHRLLFG